MKFQIASDLHLEFSRHWRLPSADADALILAGDIGGRCEGLRAFADVAKTRPVIYVPGNHEYYGSDLLSLRDEMRETAAECGIRLLDQDETVVGGVRLLGATLWTDFALFGESARDEAMQQAKRNVVDYHVVRHGHDGWLRPEHTRNLHAQAVAWLEARLAADFPGPTVVVTHHAPHPGSLHPRFSRSPISPAFVSNLERLFGRSVLWVHGHTHDSFDYAVGGCRVVCNPRGYDPFELNSDFDPGLIVAV